MAGRILGEPRLRRATGRAGELSLGLLALHDILRYLEQQRIGCYRVACELLPVATPEQALAAAERLGRELAALGAEARERGVRLTMHLRLRGGPSTPDPDLRLRLLAEVEARALLLDAIGLPQDSVLVTHLGGHYGVRAQSIDRACAALAQLSDGARRRLALEHDRSFSLNDLLHVHARTGLPVVFDHHHHLLYNPQRLPEGDALGYALQTWPAEQKPKLHLSTPRTELRISGGAGRRRIEPPPPHEHSDYLHPFEAARLLAQLRDARPCDVMVEAKAGDLAVLRLREDLRRFAPELLEIIV